MKPQDLLLAIAITLTFLAVPSASAHDCIHRVEPIHQTGCRPGDEPGCTLEYDIKNGSFELSCEGLRPPAAINDVAVLG